MTTTYWRRLAACCLVALAALVACTTTTFAQQTLGGILGTVTDASGAVVSSDRMPQLMTSWGLLYSWFERSFPADNSQLPPDRSGRPR